MFLKRILIGFIIAAALCGCDAKNESATTSEQGVPAVVLDDPETRSRRIATKPRMLNETQLDTLRSWKEHYRVTRDEHWPDEGGVLANSSFQVWYPAGNLTVSHGMYVLKMFQETKFRYSTLFGTPPPERLEILCSASLVQYQEVGKLQWWQYGGVRNDVMTLQPVPMLNQRGMLGVAIVHEYIVWALSKNNDMPTWLVHGIAAELSGERTFLITQLEEFPDDPIIRPVAQLNKELAAHDDKQAVRVSSFNAYKMVNHLLLTKGEESVHSFIGAINAGTNRDSAAQGHLNMSYDDVVALAEEWSKGWIRE
jgi:hypothetical protein